MDEEKALITPETGLTAQQVQEHLEAGLGAGLPADSGRSEKEIILRHSLTFFNLVFIVLAVLLIVGKSTVMNMGFLGVVVINTVIGIFQEIRAKRAVDKLSLVARRPVKVVRDGQVQEVPPENIVRDDLAEFGQGDQICGDGILQSGTLYVDESLLTGEEDSAVSACGVGVACLQSRQDSRSVLYDLNSGEAVELGRFDWCVMDYTPGCVTLLGSDDPDNPYTLIDLASGESIGVQRYDADYRSGNVSVLTTDNILKVYDGTTGALLTDVEAAPVEEAQYISVTALPDGYALLQYNDENYNTIAIQTYGGEGLLWSSAGEAQQYTYASYLTSTASGPLLAAHRDNSDSSNLSDVLDMEGNLLLRRLGSCYSIDDLPDDCFIARQGFDYGLMDSTGQWLYRESIFSSPSDDAGGGYLY